MPVVLVADRPIRIQRDLDSADSVGMILIGAKSDADERIDPVPIGIKVFLERDRVTGIACSDTLNSCARVHGRILGRFLNDLRAHEKAERSLLPQERNAELEPRMGPIPNE